MAEPNTYLREARLAAGLTQRELGERAGVTETQIARMERGTIAVKNVRARTIVALAKVLGISVDNLTSNKKHFSENDFVKEVYPDHYTRCRLEDVHRLLGQSAERMLRYQRSLGLLIADTDEDPAQWNTFDVATAYIDTMDVAASLDRMAEQIRKRVRRMLSFALDNGYTSPEELEDAGIDVRDARR